MTRDQRQMTNPYAGWFQPMGFILQVISNSPAVIDAARVSFGGFGPVVDRTSADFLFRFFEHPIDDGPPPPPLFRREGHLLYQTSGRDSTLAADLERGAAMGYFSPTTLANQPFFRWHFLELALFQMLEARGLMGVHASALAKNGRAILLRAPGGGGKTTLAYAGARHRFQALAEDVVWLDAARGCWWGAPWTFHLLPDARQLFPELASFEPVLQTNTEMKLEVALERLRPGSTVFTARPGPVVFVARRPGQPSELEPITAAQAHALWPLAQTGLESKLPHHPPLIEALLSQNTYRLIYGDDIDRTLDLLETLF